MVRDWQTKEIMHFLVPQGRNNLCRVREHPVTNTPINLRLGRKVSSWGVFLMRG